jgi:hypothetical protein
VLRELRARLLVQMNGNGDSRILAAVEAMIADRTAPETDA